MGYFNKREGFTTTNDLARAIVTDMIEAGFVPVFPASFTQTTKAIVLRAGENVNSLHEDQPWFVKLSWDLGADNKPVTGGGALDIIVATDRQFSSTKHATYKVFYGAKSTEADQAKRYVGVDFCVPGLIGTALWRGKVPPESDSQMTPAHDFGYGDRTFVDRRRLNPANFEEEAYPLSYRISVSDRGFALSVLEEGHDREANRSSWMIVQRPVDNKTGEVYVEGKAPVHCMYGLMIFNEENQPWTEEGMYNIRRFVVRESDIHVPYPKIPLHFGQWPTGDVRENSMGVIATDHTADYNCVINGAQQVAISENNKYIVTFPNGFNTARYNYAHELDMIAYTAADVVSEGTIVPVRVYGEEEERKYLALHANGPNNTGMRLLMLMDGAGVEPAEDYVHS